MILQRRTKPRMSDDLPPMKLSTMDVLHHVREVIMKTTTPSWLNSVPSYNFGDKSAGTLKADEWRTIATVYLPLALVPLWGEGSSHPSAAKAQAARAILDHTMILFSAVRIVCLRTMTQARMDTYRDYMLQYIDQLRVLHPQTKYKPSHHMAVHLHDFLGLFGPVHFWWCFPFERVIGLLQRQPKNHIFGELHKLSNLISVLTDRHT